ncbi:TniB family NTP-binding protein [Vibrio cholerae]|uniref:TniB family NTP-binding protein n=1 Tax=Vibrio cholerae TaxID=666 RepID=UPI0011D57AA6|nr:TniB family NTP-binding protein [Vibrio cholerae]EJB5293376.1 TniB family NTP-binding protein [Vibrio cholerae]EJL6419409.1 TniB family NTP-binding protein [Vibrio cholerae]EKF9288272.1 TniB family NTP-binding protein [Vibrio cholerae]EKF9581576.1 TniB family NTP-binding protein [Vibrio cholerae]ELA6198472.1 TniB family NTP-binding protein [Vibrio cholerae]
MSGNDHIHPDFQHILGLTQQERLDFLDEPRWIGYKSAQLIIDSLQGLIQKPKRPRMPNLLIVGDPNNGKTTVVHRFFELCGKGYVNDDAEPVKPVILAEAPPSADEKGLYMSILERFFTPYRATDPVAKLRYQVIHLCRACHVRMLIIDEFHSLLTGSPVKQREVMNAIKLLCNELAIPIVGVGTREAVRVLHTDPQHASRFDVLSLPVWQLDHDFQRLLASFEKVLPLHMPSRLHYPELAAIFHSISGGNLGDLQRLLVECSREAILTGTEHITREIVESKAWLRPTRGIREIVT